MTVLVYKNLFTTRTLIHERKNMNPQMKTFNAQFYEMLPDFSCNMSAGQAVKSFKSFNDCLVFSKR